MIRYALAALAISGVLAVAALAEQKSTAPKSAHDLTGPGGAAVESDARGEPADAIHQAGPATASGPKFIRAKKPEHLMARRLIGRSVVSSNGKPIARVKDLIVARDGRIEGVVVTFGGVFGVGAKQVAVALDDARALSLNMPTEGVLRVELTAKDLREAPAFRGINSQDRGAKG